MTPPFDRQQFLQDLRQAVELQNHAAELGAKFGKGSFCKWLAKYDVDANDIKALFPFSGHTITHFTVRKEMSIPGTRLTADRGVNFQVIQQA